MVLFYILGSIYNVPNVFLSKMQFYMNSIFMFFNFMPLWSWLESMHTYVCDVHVLLIMLDPFGI